MENLRTMVVSQDKGKDVKDTKQLSGEAHTTKAFKETNTTKQYTTGASNKGPLGGENTNS